MMTSFIGALLMIRCGTLPAPSEGNERRIKTVLATGAYRAQCFMLHHCANLLLKYLPPNRQELLKNNSVLLTGTTTSQQSSATRHTVLLTPTVLHRWTDFIFKAPKMVNALSRNQHHLCLIKPCTRRTREPPHKARKLFEIFADTAFRDCELYTLKKLTKEILGDGCTDVFATEWAERLFQECRHSTQP